MYGSPYEFELAFSGQQSMSASHAAYELPSQAQRQSRRQPHHTARRHQPSLHLIDEHEHLPYLAYSRFAATRPASSLHQTKQDEQRKQPAIFAAHVLQNTNRLHKSASQPLPSTQYSQARDLSHSNGTDVDGFNFTNPFSATPTTQDWQSLDRHSWDATKRWASAKINLTEQKRHTHRDLPSILRAGPPTMYHEMSAESAPNSNLPPAHSTQKPPSMAFLITSTSKHDDDKIQVEPVVSPLNHSMSGASRNSTVSPLSTQPSQRLQPSINRRPLPPTPLNMIEPKSSEHSPSGATPKTPGMLTAGRFIASCRELRPSTSVLAGYEVRFGSTSKGNSPIREITTIVLDSPKVNASAQGPRKSRRRKLMNFLKRLSGRQQKN